MRIKSIKDLEAFRINPEIAKTIKSKLLLSGEKEQENKYKNVKTIRIINHKEVSFDSIKEAEYFDELCLKLKAGIIKELKRQPHFDIIPTIKHQGKTLRKIIYIADFSYIENGVTFVVDVKGFRTDVYKIKKRLFLLHNPDVTFIEV